MHPDVYDSLDNINPTTVSRSTDEEGRGIPASTGNLRGGPSSGSPPGYLTGAGGSASTWLVYVRGGAGGRVGV